MASEDLAARAFSIYERAKAQGNAEVALEALQEYNNLRGAGIRSRSLPTDPVDEGIKSLSRGALQGVDFLTSPLRSIMGVPGVTFEETFGPGGSAETPVQRGLEQAAEFGVGGGAISAGAKKAFPAIARHFAPAVDAAMSALAGGAGQAVREAPSFPGQEAAAVATEIATPFAAGGLGKVLASYPLVQATLKLAGKVPTVQALRETKEMLTRSGQERAADAEFRRIVGADKNQVIREIDRALEVYGEQATTGAAGKSSKLRSIEEAYRNSDQWVPQSEILNNKYSALNAAYSRGLEYGSMPAAGYQQNQLLSKMADKLSDWSLPSIKNYMERFPEEIEAIPENTPLGHAFASIKRGEPSGINFFLDKSARNYRTARKVLGGNPYIKVDRLFNTRLRPEAIADNLMENVKSPSEYEAIVQMVASNIADRVEGWARNLVRIPEGAGDVADQIQIAKRFHHEFSRDGLTKAVEKIFRDKQAREVFQQIKDHMEGFSLEIGKASIPDIPNALVSIGGRVLGARVGRNISAMGGSGSDIQTPGIFSSAFGQAAASMTGQHFHRRMVELLTDPKLAKRVLKEEGGIVQYIKNGRDMFSLGRLSHVPSVMSELGEDAAP